jgi:hypothetical protein
MPKNLTLTFSAAILASIFAIDAGALAQSPSAAPVPEDKAPHSGRDVHHSGMMGGMNGVGPTDMAQMNRMMGNCNRMMKGPRQLPSDTLNPKSNNG